MMMRILPSCKYIPPLLLSATALFHKKTLFLSKILAETSELSICWLVSSSCIKLYMDGRGLF